MSFHETSVEKLSINPFTLINKGWMLLTAGNEKAHNTILKNRIFIPFVFLRKNIGML